MTTGHFNTAEFLAQLANGAKLMAAFEEYAIEIGCVVGTGAMCDSVACDEKQSKLLSVWWEEHTREDNQGR